MSKYQEVLYIYFSGGFLKLVSNLVMGVSSMSFQIGNAKEASVANIIGVCLGSVLLLLGVVPLFYSELRGDAY